MKMFFYIYGWVFVRPRRWFFWKMLSDGSFETRWLPRKTEYPWRNKKFDMPNFHWVFLYSTVFKFFTWVYYEGWRLFCDWTGGYRRTYPLIARAIHTIGRTTAGFAICGGECPHCGFESGDQVELADDDTGVNFILEKAWSRGTQEGTDYRFYGKTICPVCGYTAHYEDGSL